MSDKDSIEEELERLEKLIAIIDEDLNTLKSDFSDVKFVILEILSREDS